MGRWKIEKKLFLSFNFAARLMKSEDLSFLGLFVHRADGKVAWNLQFNENLMPWRRFSRK